MPMPGERTVWINRVRSGWFVGIPSLPRCFTHTIELAISCFQSKLISTQRKLAYYSSPSTGGATPIFHGCWSCVPGERVELELGLVSDLRGKGFVARNE